MFRLFLPLIESPILLPPACSSDLCPMPAILLQSFFSLAAVPPWAFIVIMAVLFVALGMVALGWRMTARIAAFIGAAMLAGVAVGLAITTLFTWILAHPTLAAGLFLGFTLGIISSAAAVYVWAFLATAAVRDDNRKDDSPGN